MAALQQEGLALPLCYDSDYLRYNRPESEPVNDFGFTSRKRKSIERPAASAITSTTAYASSICSKSARYFSSLARSAASARARSTAAHVRSAVSSAPTAP